MLRRTLVEFSSFKRRRRQERALCGSRFILLLRASVGDT